MKKLLFLLLLVGRVHAQGLPEMSPSRDSTYIRVEQMPTYPGGNAAMLEFLQKNMKYPEQAAEEKLEGRVFITFVVDKKGKVRDAKVKRSENAVFNREALRVVSIMPDWHPGYQNGVPVNVQMAVPIMFKQTNQ